MSNWVIFFMIASVVYLVSASGGEWKVLQKNIGIVAMHMQLLHNDRIVIFDRTDFGLSNISLPNGKCRYDPSEKVVKVDCTAHSIEYDVTYNTFRPLFVQTDVWCSSGTVRSDGALVQTGGYSDGERNVRIFTPCPTCDWIELNGGLDTRRWYATSHILPDSRQIVIGGRRQFNYEFFPKSINGIANNVYSLPFLVETNDPHQENNLYPFVFLNVDGNLFIMANSKAILLDYTKNIVVKTFPEVPGGDPRCYPSTGSAVLLPLRNLQAAFVEAEVLVCGGAPRGSFNNTKKHEFQQALNTCARIKITDPNPQWEMETMPGARVMSDMVMLPNGNVLLINGASFGTAGWEQGRNPVLTPFLYETNNPIGSRFKKQSPSTTPRMYHSTAILVRDGRVVVGGSNPHVGYSFENVLFPTELSLEAFSPSYLEHRYSHLRPRILSEPQIKLSYGQKLELQFQMNVTLNYPNLVHVTMLAPPFTTHSFSMNQRLLVLEPNKVGIVQDKTYRIEVTVPGSSTLAPPGFYLLFVVYGKIPSEGIWAQIL